MNGTTLPTTAPTAKFRDQRAFEESLERGPVPYSKHANLCLLKAADDEPIFVLRAKDLLAPDMIRMWAKLAHAHGADPRKVDDARACALAMEKWALDRKNRAKYPD